MDFGFPADMLPLVRCPVDAGRLRPRSGIDPPASSLRGEIVCEACEARYEIAGGILDLLGNRPPPDSISARELEARDKSVRREELESGPPPPWRTIDWMEIPSTLRRLAPPADGDLLDFGCGRGRITYHLLERCRRILAVDFSRGLLESFARRLSGRRNIGLLRADLTTIRLTPESFDRVLSSQVLEHIPAPEARSSFLIQARGALKTGGLFVGTAYAQSLSRRLKRLPKDGCHPSGIYYHCFDKSELREELAPHFEIVRIHPILIELPVLSTLHVSPAWLSRLLEPVPILGSFGHLFLVQARRRD